MDLLHQEVLWKGLWMYQEGHVMAQLLQEVRVMDPPLNREGLWKDHSLNREGLGIESLRKEVNV
tara:strand:- start:69 stop:260 length:192 start_codon:yes stop_codon:yes gene_type:complete